MSPGTKTLARDTRVVRGQFIKKEKGVLKMVVGWGKSLA